MRNLTNSSGSYPAISLEAVKRGAQFSISISIFYFLSSIFYPRPYEWY
jgi:hypothetical protein